MAHETSLFIAHTSYHVILSYAIAAKDPGRSHLFVRPISAEDRQLLDLFAGTDVFDSIRLLEHPFDEDGNHRSNRYWKRAVRTNIRTLRAFLKKTDVDAVYSALDDREEVQAAMYYAKKFGSDATGIHFEDGCYDYDFYITRWSPYRSDLLQAVVNFLQFGFKWERPPIVRGTSRYISEGYATFPDLVRADLQHLRLRETEPDALLELGRTERLDDYVTSTGISCDALSAIDFLILVPLSNSGGDEGDTGAVYEEIRRTYDEMGYTVGLKYHPRQLDDQRQLNPLDSNVIEVPKELPLELLLVSRHTSPAAVLGSVSTSLKSARWLTPTVTAITIYPLLLHRGLTQTDVDRTKLMENFEEMGVQLVESTDDLEGLV